MKTNAKAPQRTGVPIKTSLGTFLAWYSNEGLAGLEFPSPKRERLAAPSELRADVAQWHTRTCRALVAALRGKTPGTLPPLDLSAGTEFQQKVWSVLSVIPSGKTMTYAQVAHAAGKPQGARAVGGACGANPIPVLVPCHRVMASNQGLGGFSGGLDWKRKLLQIEGITLGAVVVAAG